MKKIYNILFTAIALLAFVPALHAQRSIDDIIKDPKTGAALEWPKDNGLHQPAGADFAYSKDISSPQSDGTYWIKLESFSTGAATKIRAAAPADIVLLLDLSSSMTQSRDVVDGYNAATTPGDGWTYNNVGNNHYVLYQGNYHRVSAGGGNRQRYIRFQDDSGYHYLWRDGIQDNQPTGNIGNNTVIYTGTLYTQASHTETRLQALKNATEAFILEIEKNDKYEDEAGTVEREGGRLGNRISIITFNSSANTLVTLADGELTDGKAAQLIQTVEDFTTATGTQPYKGFVAANAQLATISEARKQTASRTVVFFTDGEPYDQDDGYGTGYRYKAVGEALKTKRDYDATVYSVGLFSNTQTEGGVTWRFLNYISSNAPNATDYNTPGDGWNKDAGYYYDASDPEMDLTKVFTDIAQQSGGTSSTLSAASSNVDVVSSSFMLPEGTDTDNIDETVKVFIAKLEKIENGEYKFYKEVFEEDINEDVLGDDYEDYFYYKLDEDGKRVEPEQFLPVNQDLNLTFVDPNGIKVKGFDYSSNFCGPIYEENWDPTGHTDAENAGHVERYNGFKIIIMIPIKMNPDAVGGPNVNTNDEGSGIFVSDEATAAFVPYESPKVSLPVNIHIKKTGLNPGESAKFSIERAIIPYDDEGNWDVSDINENDWSYVSTIFVTMDENATSSTPDPVVKVKGLPANIDVMVNGVKTQKDVVYRISEEPWGWSYEADTGNEDPQYTVTSKVDNPFEFKNKKQEGIEFKVRHAESKATNSFDPDGPTVKYDDSKNSSNRKTYTETESE